MHRMFTRMAAILSVALLATATGVAAQQDQPADNGNHPQRGQGWWNADYMMDLYVKGLTRQYNLNPIQEEYTRKLLTTRVKQFLGVHEEDMRRLMWEMVEYTQKRQLPTSETAKEWAKTAQPILEDAQKAIMEGNHEWREILNDEQKKRHDRDLQALEQQFKLWNERMDRWGKGDIRETDFDPTGASERRISRQAWTHANPEDTWDMYFRGFCQRYELNDAQVATGRSILEECKQKAARFREKHKDELDGIQKKVAALQEERVKDLNDVDKAKAAQEQIDKLNQERMKIERPIISEIGTEFRKRIEDIPTTEQRRAFEQRQQARLAQLKQRREALKQAQEQRAPEAQKTDAAAATSQPES